MKIVTWNVNGIRASYKKGLGEIVAEMEPDILCLQETKAHREQVEPDAQTLGYDLNYWSSAIRKGYSGVATFTSFKPQKTQFGWGQEAYQNEGRIVWNEFEFFDLYNIYFPNGGSGEERHNFKQGFLRDLNVHLAGELKLGKKIVVVGDYNVAHQEIDIYDPVRLSKESGFLPEERAWFDQFLKLGFIDTFRELHPNEKAQYTWWNMRQLARSRNAGWRIDYICISENLRSALKSAEIHAEIEGSDHCPVSCELELR